MKNPAKETDTVTLFLRIPESLKQFLSIQAKSNGNSINREIALCLEKKMSEAMRYFPVNTTFIKPEESMTGFTIRLPGNLDFRTGTDGYIAMGKTRAGGMVMNVSGKNSGIRRHPHHKLSSQGNCYEQTIYSRIMWSA